MSFRLNRAVVAVLGVTLTALLVGLHPTVSAAQDITIRGKSFYRDNAPWLPKGVTVEGFNEPQTLRASNKIATQARSYYGPAELAAVKRVFRGDVIRIQVSQPGLDPQSSIYDAAYARELLDAVRLARQDGFVVILSMDAQAENGIPHLPCMPDQSTVRAWQTLAPTLIHDRGTMFELFNEPCKSSNPQSQSEWAQGTQAVINALRGRGATNILIVDGLWWARSTNGLFPLVRDSMPNRLALGLHPYLAKGGFQAPQQWRNQFGESATRFPLIATEWNVSPLFGCVDNTTPELALQLLHYLESLHVGLIGWAIDSRHGPITKDHVGYEPNNLSAFRDCKDNSPSGGGELLARYPND